MSERGMQFWRERRDALVGLLLALRGSPEAPSGLRFSGDNPGLIRRAEQSRDAINRLLIRNWRPWQ